LRSHKKHFIHTSCSAYKQAFLNSCLSAAFVSAEKFS